MNARGYMMSMLYCFDIPVIAVMAFRCYNFQNKAECIFMANSHRDFFYFSSSIRCCLYLWNGRISYRTVC